MQELIDGIVLPGSSLEKSDVVNRTAYQMLVQVSALVHDTTEVPHHRLPMLNDQSISFHALHQVRKVRDKVDAIVLIARTCQYRLHVCMIHFAVEHRSRVGTLT